MKKTFSLLAISALLIACGSKHTKSKTVANPTVYAKNITASNLKKHLFTYASDDFEGRETGKAGEKIASAYIKKQYKDLDIGSPIAGYFQKVPLTTAKAPEISIQVNNKSFINGTDFISYSQAIDKKLQINEMVYAGFGIDSKTYSDYKNIDVRDKFVLIKVGEPKNTDGTYVISGTKQASSWSDLKIALKSKTSEAKKRGAKGVFFYMNTHFSTIKKYKNRIYRRAMNLAIKPSDFYVVYLNNSLANSILPSILKDNVAKIIKANIAFEYKNTSLNFTSNNVLAHIKGSEKPDEYIVISAHLDHLGTNGDAVYNGADDDGSGTVSVIEIAKAFQKAKKEGHGPKRSILFLHVTGEEKGLLGSRHYTNNDPIIPLANTVADLNIDMIGRIDPKRTDKNRNYLYLIGADKLSTELHEISENVNKKYCNILFDYTFNDENDPNRFYYRSDHYNFAKNNIPVIFYFNGTHEDYHQESDTPDKIEYDLLENRARLIFYTAWELANRDARIVVDKASK